MTTLAAQLRRAGVAERAIPALVARETAERGAGAQRDVRTPIVAPTPLAPTARAIRTAPGGATVALNRTEQAYALHLDAEKAAGRIAGYAVQPFRLDIGRDGAGRPVTYRPDFAVWRRAGALELHEVKAPRRDAPANARRQYRAEDDALVKLAAVAALYPWQPLVVVWPDAASRDGWAREWRVPPEVP